MADTVPATEAAPAGETFSKEYVEKLKQEAAARDEENAKLRAFKATHDEQQRGIVTKLQPEVMEFMGVLNNQFPDHVPQMSTIDAWSKNAHESNSLESAVPLSRVISCASALYKRTREEASQNAEKAGNLGDSMKKIEELEASDAKKTQRITELEALCNERQANAQAMQDELARAGLLKDKFDFSKTASREATAATPATEAGAVKSEQAQLNMTTGAAGASATLTAVTSQASRQPMDDLLSYVTGKSTSIGSHRIGQSGTGHAILGAGQGSVDDEIASAIRAA